MTTSLRDKLKWLVFGQPCFFPYSSQDVLARSGRFYIGVSWTEYRRRRALPLQLLLGSQRKVGLLEVAMHFNPGVPAELFEAFLEMGAMDEDTVMTFIPATSEEGFESFEDVLEQLEDGIQNNQVKWSCSTVLRSAEDLMELHNWIDSICELTKDKPEVGGTLNEQETQMTRRILSDLTERYSTCQLNS